MNYIRRFSKFIVGQNAKFGTLANLLREVVVGVGAAVAVTLLIDRFLPAPTTISPVAEAHSLAIDLLHRQHVADSTIDAVKCERLSAQIDSLRRVIEQRDVADSLRVASNPFDIGPLLPLKPLPW